MACSPATCRSWTLTHRRLIDEAQYRKGRALLGLFETCGNWLGAPLVVRDRAELSEDQLAAVVEVTEVIDDKGGGVW